MAIKPKLALFTCFVILLFSLQLIAQPCNAQTLDHDVVQDMQNYCYGVDYNTAAEIVVVIFPSLYGHGTTDSQGNEINGITQLGEYILNSEPLKVHDGTQIGIGKPGENNGVLVLVALEEKEWVIEVGDALANDINETETNLIGQTYIVPAFQNGNYSQGLYDAVVALGGQIPLAAEPDTLPVRGVYYYESTGEPAPTPFLLINCYGQPVWLIIIIILIVAVGVAALVFVVKSQMKRSRRRRRRA